MPTLRPRKLLTYPDGICDIVTVTDRRITGTKYSALRFGRETVGVTRFWRAKIAASEIDRAIRVPMGPDISRRDVVIIDGRQYKIAQLQVKDLSDQQYQLLSLQSIQTAYADTREG